jgi:PleD family two-component response regulator
LREFAAFPGSAFRGSDVTARLDGDVFAVLMIGTADADRAIARPRDALAGVAPFS